MVDEWMAREMDVWVDSGLMSGWINGWIERWMGMLIDG